MDVLADRTPLVRAQASLHLIDMRIVGVDLALYVGELSVMRLARVIDLTAPLGFAVPVICLGLVECLPGGLTSSLVLLLATENPLEPARRLGFELCPLRSRDRDGELI